MTLRASQLILIALLFGNIALAQMPFDSVRLIQSAEVYFDFGKADLCADADSTLQQLVAGCPDQAHLNVHITAHTDAIGSNDANVQLSQNRANAVRDALVAKGLPDSIFQTSVFGESRPVATNSTDAGRQMNRRAVIEVYEHLRMLQINGKVVNPDTGGGIVAEVIVGTRAFRDTLQTDTSGVFTVNVLPGEIFGIDVFAPGYFFETRYQRAVVGDVPRLEIPLKPVAPGASMDLKYFYFVGNQDTLLKRSEPELPKLLYFMHLNPLVQIEIGGHINLPNNPPVPEDSWNYDLSVRRAKRIYNYLIANGIDPIHLVYKGYGNWQMRYPHAKEETQQALNRRVEIKVLSVKE